MREDVLLLVVKQVTEEDEEGSERFWPWRKLDLKETTLALALALA